MESHLILVFISTVLVTAVLGQGVHLELKGEIIPNNSVVMYRDIGTSTITLRCVTERVDCCSTDNSTRADWFTPSGEVADRQFSRLWTGLGEAQGSVYIIRRTTTSIASVQQGLYHCIIPAPNDDTSTLYVGIYIRINTNVGKPTISGITYKIQLSPEMFTLTCTSTGGPATTVTWILNCSEIAYDANHVLTQTVVNTTTAEYNNTLTVTGREPGNYQCTVSNARGNDTSQLLVVNNSTGTTAPTPPSCSSSLIMEQLSTTPKPSTTIVTTPGSQSTSSAGTPNSSSPSQLPILVIIAGAVAGLILCIIIIIVVLVLALTVCKRRKRKKTQGQYNIQHTDDTRSSVNQNQTNPSTGQTLTVQSGDDGIMNKSYLPSSRNATMADSSDPTYSVVTSPNTDPVYSVVTEPPIDQPNSLLTQDESDQIVRKKDNDGIKHRTYSSSSQNHTTIPDCGDPLYSVITDTTTPNVDSVYSVVTEPAVPMTSIGQPNSLLTHYENVQTVRKNDESTFEGDLSSTKL